MRRAARTGEATLRAYSWRAPSLSFGRNQSAAGMYDAGRAGDLGVEVVRRPTGGRALLHHREVTYSVTAPATAGDLRATYARINRLLLHALQSLGVDARLAEPSGRSPLPGDAPCFETPVEGELVFGGRKLVGSAQWRDGSALLQHGSILVNDDQPMLARLATRPIPPAPPAATLRDALGRVPPLEEVVERLFDAVRALEDPDARGLAVDDALEADTATLREKYRDGAWTWRR